MAIGIRRLQVLLRLPTEPALLTVTRGAARIFFAFYKARKAANLNPIEALHYEQASAESTDNGSQDMKCRTIR